jgi:hypothetical protein
MAGADISTSRNVSKIITVPGLWNPDYISSTPLFSIP